MGFIISIKEFCQKMTSKKGFYLIASIPWVVFCLVYGMWSVKSGFVGFESNDDIFMNLISSGAYGSPDSHNIYNNIILGFIYTVFYRISPNHNWNTLIQLMAILVSYITFGVWNINRNKIFRGYLASFALFFCTWETMVCRINYSKTGAIVLGVGFVLLASSADHEEWLSISNRLIRILSYFFIIGGGLFRKDTLIACIPFLFIPALYIFIKYHKEQVIRLIPFAGALVALAACWLVNYIAYSSSEEWRYFKKYNEVRTELLDYGMPSYYYCMEEYGALGLSECDYSTLKKWRFADENVFSLENLESLVKIRDAKLVKQTAFEKIEVAFNIAEILNMTWLISMSMLFTFFSFLVTVSINSRKKFLYQLMTFLLCMAELLALLIKGRVVERALYLPVIVAFMIMMFFQDETIDEVKSIITSAAILISVTLFSYYASGIKHAGDKFEGVVYDKTAIEALFSYTADNKDNLYIIDVSTDSDYLFRSYSALDHLSTIPHDNIALMGGWQVPSPAVTRIAEPYTDAHNLFKALATNSNIFWISELDPKEDDFCYYMLEHYGKEVTVLETVGGFYICSFANNSYE